MAAQARGTDPIMCLDGPQGRLPAGPASGPPEAHLLEQARATGNAAVAQGAEARGIAGDVAFAWPEVPRALVTAVASQARGADLVAFLDRRQEPLRRETRGSDANSALLVKSLLPGDVAIDVVRYRSAGDLARAMTLVQRGGAPGLILLEEAADDVATAMLVEPWDPDRPALCTIAVAAGASGPAGALPAGCEIGLVELGSASPPGLLSRGLPLSPRTVLASALATIDATGSQGLELVGVVHAALCIHDRRLPSGQAWARGERGEAWCATADSRLDIPGFVMPWAGPPGSRFACVLLGDVCLILGEPGRRRLEWRSSSSVQPVPRMLTAAASQAQADGVPPSQARQALAHALKAERSAGWLLSAADDASAIDALASRLQRPHGGTVIDSGSGSAVVCRPLGQADVAFVYPGSGSVFTGFTERLFDGLPHLLEETRVRFGDKVDGLLTNELWFPRHAHWRTRGSSLAPGSLQDAAEVALLMTQFELLGSQIYTLIARNLLNLRPKAALGISVGAVGMLYAIDGRPELHRTLLFDDPSVASELAGIRRRETEAPDAASGVWLAVSRSEELSQALVRELDRDLVMRCSPRVLLTRGHFERIHELSTRHGFRYALTPVGLSALHTPAMLPDIGRWRSIGEGVPLDAERLHAVDFYLDASPVRASAGASGLTRLKHSVLASLARPVDFVAMVRGAYRRGVRIFVTCGPDRQVSRWIDEILDRSPHLAIPLAPGELDAWQALRSAAAILHSHGFHPSPELL